MYFVSLLHLRLISFADGDALVDIFYFLPGFLLEMLIFSLDAPDCFFYLVNFMTLELFGVLVNALHAHYFSFLLAVEHEVLLVDVALGGKTVFSR